MNEILVPNKSSM